MKRKILFIMILCASLDNLGAQNNNNYVKTIVPTVATASTSGLTVNNSLSSYQYFDGIGRAQQTVQVGMNPDKRDIVSYQEYDVAGREWNTWLPVVAASGNNGMGISLNTVQTLSASLYNDSKAYSKPVYDESPLNRVLEQYGPGQEWHNNGKSVKTEYFGNSQAHLCRWYHTADVRDRVEISILSGMINYPAWELYITQVTDEENQGVIQEFKNKQGQLILRRQLDGNQQRDTYYVYDSYGNLRAVLPPAIDLRTAGTFNEATATIEKYAYLYKYDNRNRMIGKKLPGCDWITYRYDKADRMIFSQDGEQAAKSPQEWTFHLCDAFNREVVRGECRDPGDVSNMVLTTSLQPNQNSIENTGYYINRAPLPSMKIHQVNYYDDYSFRTKTGFYYNSNFPAETYSGKGMLTGSVTTVLDSSTKLYSANYYDQKGRLVNMVSSNHLGGYDKTTTTYTFTGKPKTVTHVHSASGKSTQTQVYTYTYDHAERVKTVTHKLNSGSTVTLENNTYDSLGRLQRNGRNGVSSLADSYTYNVRSWVTKISATQFTENLTYTYNGNILEMQWITGGQTRKYMFTYDALSRLKTADYIGVSSLEDYKTRYKYSKHGSLQNIHRYGKKATGVYGIVDSLVFESTNANRFKYGIESAPHISLPESNDFKKKANTASEYEYNKNGAMTKDLNKGITSISYNFLNLPKEVIVNGSIHNYMYAADGKKLRVMHGSNTRDYVGNIVYENGSLKCILVNGGYIEGGIYYFYLNDHQGNNRIVATAGGTVIQRNHFYPFGLPFAETSDTEQNKQPFKYNGKEFEREDGLNWIDYGARMYDPAMGRFTTMDPMAEKYPWISPYAYCANNPMRYVDPTGMDWWTTNDPDEIERVLLSLKTNSKVDTESFGSQWTRITDSELVEGMGIFDDVANDFSVNGESWENAGYGIKDGFNPSFQYNDDGFDNFNIGNHLIGPSLYLLGRPIKFLKPVGVLGSRAGSSIASYTLSKLLPIDIGKKGSAMAFRLIGSRTTNFGRLLGRLIPYVGVGITILDLYYSGVVKPNVKQVQNNVQNNKHPLDGVYNPQTGDFMRVGNFFGLEIAW